MILARSEKIKDGYFAYAIRKTDVVDGVPVFFIEGGEDGELAELSASNPLYKTVRDAIDIGGWTFVCDGRDYEIGDMIPITSKIPKRARKIDCISSSKTCAKCEYQNECSLVDDDSFKGYFSD
jgi:hypothetical protein